MITSAVLWLSGSGLIAWRSPGLIRERMRPGAGALEGMGEEIALYGVPAAAHRLLAAADRPGAPFWRPMPAALQGFGYVGYALSNLIVIWAELTNPYFSSAVRVQAERGQHVISSGPYALIRHPGYASGIALFISSAFALGSWSSLAPSIIFSTLIVRRMRMEDRFLQANLQGYRHYAERVRFRLVPGVW